MHELLFGYSLIEMLYIFDLKKRHMDTKGCGYRRGIGMHIIHGLQHMSHEANPGTLEIVEEFQHHSLYWDDYCGTLLKAILIRILQLWQMGNIGVDKQKGKTILSYIHAHWNEPLSNRQIAAHFGYHEYYISSLVRKYTGLPLHRYVLRYKMHMAVELLQSTTLSVGEVASKVAMPDIKHFSKCFKNMMGVPPSHFRAGTDN